MKIWIFILSFLAFKVIYNLYYLLLAKKYYEEYIKFVKDTDSESWFIRENKQKIIKLFIRAGIQDAHQPNVEPVGYGMITTGNISVFHNLTILREDIIHIINGDFREAIGVYKQRILETFNPIYWMETFFQLPRIILEYLGVKSGSIIVKLFQVIWWIIVAISTFVGIFFNKEFTSWIQAVYK